MSTDLLEQLRAKTDRQLLMLLQKQLQACIANPTPLRDQAACCCQFAATVAPTLRYISDEERQLLRDQIKAVSLLVPASLPRCRGAAIGKSQRSRACKQAVMTAASRRPTVVALSGKL